MATLIPALGTCLSRMTSGERRLAERLEQKTRRRLPALVRRARRPQAVAPGLCDPASAPRLADPGDQRLAAGDHQAAPPSRLWEIIRPTGGPRSSSTRWRRRGIAPSRWSTRWSATRNWCSPAAPTKASSLSPGATAWCSPASRAASSLKWPAWRGHRAALRDLLRRNDRVRRPGGISAAAVGHVPPRVWQRHVAPAAGPRALDHVPRGARAGAGRAV